MSTRDPTDLYRKFPLLQSTQHEFTSEATTEYNCLAWVLGEQNRWISPDLYDEDEGLYPWPANVPREHSVQAWVMALETFGFRITDDLGFEEGVDKIAIYYNSDTDDIHFAKQLSATMWTSKVGQWEDLSHELNGLSGSAYGQVIRFMVRRRSGLSPY